MADIVRKLVDMSIANQCWLSIKGIPTPTIVIEVSHKRSSWDGCELLK